MSKRKSSPSPAPVAQPDLPAPSVSQDATVETPAASADAPVEPEAPEALPTTETASSPATSSDLDNDGHDDATGQFVAGNTEASNVSEVEGRLNAAVAALLVASTAYAAVAETPQFVLIDGYRLQFAGHDLMTLTVN